MLSPEELARIRALQLEDDVEAAAVALKEEQPSVIFISGRRTVHEQARAMASNIVASRRRRWIEETYPAGAKLQQWVDRHPAATTVPALAAGLEGVLNAMSERERFAISKHFNGRAFDVRPPTHNAAAIEASIRGLAGFRKLLTREGGLVRWHVQF